MQLESNQSKSNHQTEFTVFMLLTALPQWLSLSRKERQQYREENLLPILAEFTDVAVNVYDAEAFSANCSDILVFTTKNLTRYYHLIEHLRDSLIFSKPYFQVNMIIPAIRDGYLQLE